MANQFEAILENLRERQKIARQNNPEGPVMPKYECTVCNDSGLAPVEGTENFVQCKCQDGKRMQRLFRSSGLNENEIGLKFSDFEITDDNSDLFMVAERYVRTRGWLDRKGFALMGNVGTGKTMLSMTVANEALRASLTVLYLPTFALMRELRNAQFSQDKSEYMKRYNELINADLLILDDVGKEKPTDWVKEEYFSIINTRYREEKPIGFTSNYSIKDLVDRFGENGDAIVSRLIAMTKGYQVYTKAQDFRIKGLKTRKER